MSEDQTLKKTISPSFMTTPKTFFKVYNASAGSGKTFTLVKEYLKIALDNHEFEFQKILAITFTNKAASEMKQRVLDTLKDASQKTANDLVNTLLQEMNISAEEMQRKAQRVLSNILHHYASFNIITIDSFTHKLIRTFSLDLGLPLDFEVAMDIQPLLTETVDLLIAKIGQDKDLTKVLVSYAIGQVNDDKSWNITNALVEIAKLLLNEEDEVEVSKLMNTHLFDFQKLEKGLRAYLKDTEQAFREVGSQALDLIDENNIPFNAFSYGDFPKYFKKLQGSCFLKEKHPLNSRLAKSIEAQKLYTSSKAKDAKTLADRNQIDLIKDELLHHFDVSLKLCEAHFGQYLLVKKILKTLVPLAVLNHLNKEFTQLKEENNFRLNAEFNRIISKQIKDEPVPFIYERLGEKYQYFFIDEMQDTSALQWENLIPLIHNSLSQNKGGLLLVGDAKQSIYRWRGGKAAQFIDLSNIHQENPFFIDKEVVTLDTNYRSYDKIVLFNNDFFEHISHSLEEPDYQNLYENEKNQKTNTKEGGYVYLEVFERENDFDAHTHYTEKIHQLIIDIQKNGFDRGDICILTRNTKDGIAVADGLTSQGIEVISPDSLLLKNNPLVQFFIFLLRWIENTEDKEMLLQVLYFLHPHLEIKTEEHDFYHHCIQYNTSEDLFAYLNINFSITTFFSQSLYDGIETLIRAFKLSPITDVFVQAFLDLVLQFQLKESGGLQSFLQYWDQKKKNLKVEIAPNKNAVQIMTIHKSKGLEFPIVIFPFDLNTKDINRESIWYATKNNPLFQGFSSFRINASDKLSMYGEQGVSYLEAVNKETQLDNFNLLYVALTRAEEQLYILSDTKGNKNNTLKNYSDYFKSYIERKGGNFVYELGTPQRLSKNEKRQDVYVLDTFESIDKTENQIYLVQGNEDYHNARHYGNMIHEAFEKIISVNDIEKANLFIDQQDFDSKTLTLAKECIENVIYHPTLKAYYLKGLEVYNERSFITENGNINIMDRLIFKDNTVTIIDYKTGKPDHSHQLQMNHYAKILIDLGYHIEHKFLVYCNHSVEVKKV